MTAAIVVCAANLTGMDVCPRNCRKCYYGGDISISWKQEGQQYVQYFPNKHTIREEVEAAKQGEGDVDERILEMQTWLNEFYPDWSKVKVLETEPHQKAPEVSYKAMERLGST